MAGAAKLGLLSALVLGALGLLAWSRLSRPRVAAAKPAPATVNRPEQTAPSQVERELARLRAEVAGLKEQVNRPPPPAEPSPPEPEPVAPQPTTAEAAQTHFEHILETEPLDAAWARAEEQSIRDFVQAEAGEGAALESVSCRSSMCRLKLSFPSDGGRDTFKLKLGLPPLSNGGFYKEEGETGLAYYAARAGHPLPAVPSD
jgi:hypothetical protein